MADNDPKLGFDQQFSEQSFWTKLRDYALSAGQSVVEKALALYYCALDADTPAWARATIYSALGYFILPLDVIPDTIPGAGFTDDLGVLAEAFALVASHLKASHLKASHLKASHLEKA